MKILKVTKLDVSRCACMLALFVLTPLLNLGCATGGKYMIEASRISEPEQGKALITFVRPSGFGGGISFGLWDDDNFVGVLGPSCCIQYETVPGEHYFLARAENWSCVKADVAPDRHYVIKTNPFMGVWKARVAFDPITKSDYQQRGQTEDARKWIAKLRPMTVDPQQREAYARPRSQQVREAKAMFESGEGKYEALAREDYLPE